MTMLQLPRLLLALIAGGILPFAFAPFHLFFIAFLSSGILAFLWRKASPSQGAWTGFCFGIGLFGIGASWIFVSIHQFSHTPAAIAVLITALFIIILSLFIALQGFCYTRFFKDRYLVLLFAFPSLWVLFEWIRGFLFSGFPWLYMGYSQIDTVLAGFAPIIGVYGLSFLAVLTGMLFLSYFLYPRRYIFSTCLLFAIWLGGFFLQRIDWTVSEGDAIQIALLQGDIDQNLKWDTNTREFILQRYEILMREAKGVETLIWPEASLPITLPDAQPILDTLANELQQNQQNALIGLIEEKQDGYFYNAIKAIGPDSSGIYYKRQLVPFGEYVPMENLLRGIIGFFDLPMSHVVPGPHDQALLQAGRLKFASLICYEIVYPSLALNSLRDANILLTVSNDAWFGKSIGPHQHFQMARMRALELGRYLVRATNNGITAIVDPKGRVISQAPQFIATTLVGKVYESVGKTPLFFLTHYFVVILSSLLLLVIGFYYARQHARQ